MAEQKPSIGRIVHFFDREQVRLGKRLGPYAAMITWVWSDTTVDVSRILGPGDVPSDNDAMRSVPMVSSGDGSWWQWPERV